MLTRNYHTHTYRCHHAVGTEREYVEAAIRAGIKTLGISDHAPYIFKEDYYSTGIRMQVSELPEYVETLLALREEYKNDIKLLIGFEAEYSYEHFDDFRALVRHYPIDYLILGQHYIGEEYERRYAPPEYTDADRIKAHMQQQIDAIRTGFFSYVAHPDMIKYNGDDETYAKYARPLCEEAKRLGIPLEINFLGLRDHRNYPTERFFKIAGEVGNTVIFGCDAHSPDVFEEKTAYPLAKAMAEKFGLTVTDGLRLGLLKNI